MQEVNAMRLSERTFINIEFLLHSIALGRSFVIESTLITLMLIFFPYLDRHYLTLSSYTNPSLHL